MGELFSSSQAQHKMIIQALLFTRRLRLSFRKEGLQIKGTNEGSSPQWKKAPSPTKKFEDSSGRISNGPVQQNLRYMAQYYVKISAINQYNIRDQIRDIIISAIDPEAALSSRKEINLLWFSRNHRTRTVNSNSFFHFF